MSNRSAIAERKGVFGRTIMPHARKQRSRAQGAMEFLMTYGWSILIIAVVLGALFRLGVFNGGAAIGNSCVPTSGFFCRNQQLVTAGTLTFNFGQDTGSPLYNFQLACTASANSLGFPYPITAFNSISSAGAVLPSSNAAGNFLGNGQTMTISSLPCYGTTGTVLGSTLVGTSFTGFIWVNYTANPGTATAATNPWRTVKAASIKATAG